MCCTVQSWDNETVGPRILNLYQQTDTALIEIEFREIKYKPYWWELDTTTSASSKLDQSKSSTESTRDAKTKPLTNQKHVRMSWSTCSKKHQCWICFSLHLRTIPCLQLHEQQTRCSKTSWKKNWGSCWPEFQQGQGASTAQRARSVLRHQRW